jgi:hypothetical protein
MENRSYASFLPEQNTEKRKIFKSYSLYHGSTLQYSITPILQGVFISGDHEIGSVSSVQGKFKFSGIS